MGLIRCPAVSVTNYPLTVHNILLDQRIHKLVRIMKRKKNNPLILNDVYSNAFRYYRYQPNRELKLLDPYKSYSGFVVTAIITVIFPNEQLTF